MGSKSSNILEKIGFGVPEKNQTGTKVASCFLSVGISEFDLIE